MLRDIAGHSDGMLFRQSIVPSLKVAQLWILCHTSKDFYGMFRPCVISCLDLKDDQLQRAFVARLLNAIARKKWPSEMRSATMCRATMAELVSKGHDLEQRDDSGMTALMWASYNGQADTARVLVKHGASLEAADREDGMTALLWARYEGHADTVRVL
jgi:ankyrin repeat protein